jgi:hypothetical protein
MSVVIETKDLPSEDLSTAVASSGFGTKRNCLGAHGISGAEGRPAVPSTCRRQPPVTQSCPSRRLWRAAEGWKRGVPDLRCWDARA